jgi:hypothetical protein
LGFVCLKSACYRPPKRINSDSRAGAFRALSLWLYRVTEQLSAKSVKLLDFSADI